MKIREIRVSHPLGLHARSCARIVQVAARFRSNISLSIGSRRASARNIVAMMMLAAAMGATVRIEVDGPDERAAMSAIVQVIDQGHARHL